MDPLLLHAYISVAVISSVSLLGVITFAISKDKVDRFIFLFIGLAIGALLGDTIIHLLPDALDTLGSTTTSLFFAAGFLFFFLLEKLLHWRHGHGAHEHQGVAPVGYLNLIADVLHNTVDGMLIGASYLVAGPIGLASTIAVVFHEIPKEFGDYGIYLRSGFSRSAAVWLNVLSAVAAFIGLSIALSLGQVTATFSTKMLAVTAGGFIYIVATLLRELRKELPTSKTFGQVAMMILGFAIMWLIAYFE